MTTWKSQSFAQQKMPLTASKQWLGEKIFAESVREKVLFILTRKNSPVTKHGKEYSWEKNKSKWLMGLSKNV